VDGVESSLLANEPLISGSGGLGQIDAIAEATEGYSGSDLMELCAQVSGALLRPVAGVEVFSGFVSRCC